MAIVGANDNLVEGDFIGTDVTGKVALGNNSELDPSAGGVFLYSGASGNTIGGLTATPGTGAGNLISGNTFAGVSMSGCGAEQPGGRQPDRHQRHGVGRSRKHRYRVHYGGIWRQRQLFAGQHRG